MKYSYWRQGMAVDQEPSGNCVVCGRSHVCGMMAEHAHRALICDGCALGLQAALLAHNAEVIARQQPAPEAERRP